MDSLPRRSATCRPLARWLRAGIRKQAGKVSIKVFGKGHKPEEVADWLKRRAPLFDPADPC